MSCSVSTTVPSSMPSFAGTHSRAVIGWALEARLTGDLTQQALMAIRHRTPNAGLLHHSDRGSQ